MRIEQMKRNQKVEDRWWPEWGVGRVKEVLKTRVRILFPTGLLTYDREHVQFLQRPARAR